MLGGLDIVATHTLEWISFTTHTLAFFFFLKSILCLYRNNMHAPIISRRGCQSVRGIFRLTDFHLQSGDVTFVLGNEIAVQQTVGYIIPSSVHILLSLFFFPLSFICGFFSHCSSAPETQTHTQKKEAVSQDQLVTSRELWSGETKATAMLTWRRGDKASWSSFQAINVTSSPCMGKVGLTAAWCPATTWRQLSKEQLRSLTLFSSRLYSPILSLHLFLLNRSAHFIFFSSVLSLKLFSSPVFPSIPLTFLKAISF